MKKNFLRVKINGIRKRGIIADDEISGYIADFLTEDRIHELYLMLDMRNSIILLRAIAKQYLCNKFELKLDVLEEVMYDKCIFNEKIIQIFIAFAEDEELEAFVKMCDVMHAHQIQL